MQISLNTSKPKWYDRFWAALCYFTRLPLRQIHQPKREGYTSVIEFWPICGWISGGFMVGVFWLASQFLSLPISLILALISRILLTGAFHENGLANLIDGLSEGGSREQIIYNIEERHIGAYGVITLVMYAILLFFTINEKLAASSIYEYMLFIVAVDSYSKMLAGQIVQFLPQIITENTVKSGVICRPFRVISGLFFFIQGILPMLGYLYLTDFYNWESIIFGPCFVLFFMYMLIARKMSGYTKECFGALFLTIELACYLISIAII